jgi:hypothetical protein
MIHTTNTLVSVQNRQRRRHATGQRLLPDFERHRKHGVVAGETDQKRRPP